ncbi:uncharacterized protein MELLADRAFT_88045 [Melampsora larici-populina 98AG31]|uniref:DH domain-containing protein n=1 Tax=Melampsora larici-populina (strain 98AG31 / pathotype 3-4-7) TaxID=747676 RepID=F4RQ86_MELLP|nr:uncharacterized protein MELLADRAFT_88045 [Melampsora larici-populina 98AG31]EGG05447.1 hypothetical protein MELLADRAFT_88045 [Melampsora larici-populina 98AG31]
MATTRSSLPQSSITSSYVPNPPPPPRSSASASILQRQPSTISIDMPVATSSVVNKTANRSASLYQNCLEARALMRRVPGFETGPWITNNPLQYESQPEPLTPRTPHTLHSSNPLDPVSQTLEIVRLGSSLCYLYNSLHQAKDEDLSKPGLPPLPAGKTWRTIKTLNVAWCPREDLKGCQKSAAHFIMAVKTELGWGTEIDEYQGENLMVNMLYDQNTNATVKVISNVLRLLRLLETLGVLEPPQKEDEILSSGNDLGIKLDDRARVVKEILESERKYVQDLEVLQATLLTREIMPSDQIRSLFMNLDSLVDFQRRFLIGVEANARLPHEDQRFGHLFATMEEHFVCYEPFCANFASASQLAQDENAALSKVSEILDPNYELPTFLIKPVQRICKYPLLLQQLVKHSDPKGPFFEELKEGLASITRVTDAVNETTRQRENELAVNDLKERVEDWKGHELSSFGALVLEDTFTVVKNDSEREYHVYLFERIILCCKEVGIKLDKKASKQSMSLKKSQANLVNGPKKKNTQQLKGRIFIANVMSANPRPVPPGCINNPNLLQVTWRGDISEEYFSIKCRTEEQLKKWQAAITKAVDEAVDRRRKHVHHLSSSSRTKANSPLSQFPNTPQSEMGPPPPPHSAGYYHHHHNGGGSRINEYGYHTSSLHGPSSISGSSRTFDDEDDYYQTDHEASTSGRNTPSDGGGLRRPNGHRSMPAERSGDQNFSQGRARAQTDDVTSLNLTTWRNQMPASMPPLPRSSQTTMTTMSSGIGEGMMNDGSTPSLRSSTSSKHLRTKPSHEWGTSSQPHYYQIEEEALPHLPSASSQLQAPPYSQPSTQSSQSSQRRQHGSITAAAPPPLNPQDLSPPLFRSRSASSPNIHQNHPLPNTQWSLPPGQLNAGPPLPLPKVPLLHHHQHHHSNSRSGMNQYPAGVQVGVYPGGNGVEGERERERDRDRERERERGTGSGKRVSGTSVGSTDRSSIGSTGVGDLRNSSIRFKLRSGEDVYVIVCLPTISYEELIEKINMKLPLSNGAGGGSGKKLKIRYEDEDGDWILICNDEDIRMALDWMYGIGENSMSLMVD